MTEDEHLTGIVREGVRLGIADFFDVDVDDIDSRKAFRAWSATLVSKYKRQQQWSAVMPVEISKVFLTAVGSVVIGVLGWLIHAWTTVAK
jgi:hypothetical protein